MAANVKINAEILYFMKVECLYQNTKLLNIS